MRETRLRAAGALGERGECRRVATSRWSPPTVAPLADHIQFAIERTQRGIDLRSPLESEVARVYPAELELGRQAVGMIAGRTGIAMPDDEAVNIALHIVDAEGAPGMADASTGNLHDVMESTSVIEGITETVERCYDMRLDTSSYEFARFAAHLRFLVSRLSRGGTFAETTNRSLFGQAAVDFPQAYRCAMQVDKWLRDEKGWKCSEEELLYLMMHINRLAAVP